jgi:hypothetical protein
MKNLQRLALCLLEDLGRHCCVDTARDCKTVSSRIEHEGDQFLTITLPSFGKDFDKSLDLGLVADDLFLSFRKRGGLPLFLRGFLQLVFDPMNGSLLMKPSVEAIYAVRQFSLTFGKIFELPTPRRERDAMRNFINTEEELKTHDRGILANLLNEGRLHGSDGLRSSTPGHVLSRSDSFAGSALLGRADGDPVPGLRHGDVGRTSPSLPTSRRLPVLLQHFEAACVSLYGNSLGRIEADLWSSLTPRGIIPQHGPGATADRRQGNEKYRVDEWPLRLEEEFPFIEWVLPSARHHVYLDGVNFLTPEQERPVRVISVPKTAKTPRIIAIEPTAMQYIQQALGRRLVDELESSTQVSPMIGFRDQMPNQQMAQKGSLDGSLATLDLSEASDRVSNLHVLQLLARWPGFSRAVQACRSTKADVQGHGVIPLSKYASMGSGLTFPIEAMVFLAIVVTSILVDQAEPITQQSVRRLHGRVRVYGDDIIVPREHAVSVAADLEAFGLKVNRNKSFWTGLFRESCGGDFYNGHRVTPVRLRRRFPTSRKDAEEIASLVSFRNQVYEAGLWTTACWLDSQIARVLPRFPIVEPTSVILGRHSLTFAPQAEWICADTHVPLVKGCRQVARLPENTLDDVHALMKWFIYKEKAPQGDPLQVDHLQHSGRARATRITKPGWHRPY